MTKEQYEQNKDKMAPYTIRSFPMKGHTFMVHKTSGFFCKHCTDVFYDTDGPYMLMCDILKDTPEGKEMWDGDGKCWTGECERFEPEEKFEDDLIQHVGYSPEQCGREK